MQRARAAQMGLLVSSVLYEPRFDRGKARTNAYGLVDRWDESLTALAPAVVVAALRRYFKHWLRLRSEDAIHSV